MNALQNCQSICFVIPNFVTFSTGGAEIQVYYLTQAFIKRGWQVEVVCAGKGHENTIEKSPYLDPGIKYHYYKRKSIRVLEYFEVIRVLKKTNARYYYQRTDFALTFSTFRYTKKNNKTMVYALAGDTDSEKNKYSILFKEFTYTNLLKKWVRKTDFFWLDRMIESAKRKADIIVFQNEYQKENYLNNFKRSGAIVPNSFQAPKEQGYDKENIVLWCGNNNPVKRPELFVQLASAFEEVVGWSFVMLGKACESIQDHNLPANVVKMGSVSYEEANRWFARAKVYVNTSSSEGMPNTFIQSWYYKTLILSLAVNPDQVFSKQNAGFCFNNDLKALEKKLKRLIEGEDAQTEIRKGFQYFNAHFNLDVNVDKLMRLMSGKEE